jgi:hypothetical protein
MEFIHNPSTTAVLDNNHQTTSISLSSGSSNSNITNRMKKSSSFTLTKKRIPTKLALLKPVESHKTMVRSCEPGILWSWSDSTALVTYLMLISIGYSISHTRNMSLCFLYYTTQTSTTASQKLPQQSVSPQDFLDDMLRSRGYSCERYESIKSAYFNKPTPLQKASYQNNMIQMLGSRDSSTIETLRRILSSGVSSNPCNAFSESLVHLVCRRGRHDVLELFLEAGCSLQCADDYGRTPLHDACWTAEPSFPTVELLLQQDSRLLHMLDARGTLPLHYVHKDHWPAWIDFLESVKDTFWKPRSVTLHGEQGPPALVLQAPNSRPLPDPNNALAPDLACLVAAGKIDPSEVMIAGNESEMTHSDDADSANNNSGEGSDSSSCDSSGGDSEEDNGEEQVQDEVAFCIDSINMVQDDDGKYSTGGCNDDELLSTSTVNDSTDDFDMNSYDDDDDDDNISAAMAAAMLAAQFHANLFR